jgi:hypothetical protein
MIYRQQSLELSPNHENTLILKNFCSKNGAHLIVSRYEEMVVEEKGDKKSQSYFSELFNEVKKDIPASYFRHYTNEDQTYQSLRIYDPKLKFEIEIRIITISKNTKYENSDVRITFFANKHKM